MIVVVIVHPVIVEPRLHPFRKVFVMIHAGILALPQSGRTGRIVRGLQTPIEGRIDVDHAAQVDIMCELVDKYALGGVGVAWKAEEVLLRARAIRVVLATAQASSAGIPVIFARYAEKPAYSFRRKPRRFGLIGRKLVVGEDTHARTAANHGVANVGPPGK